MPEAESLRVMENAVRDLTSQLGQVVLGAWLTHQDPKYPVERVTCSCGAPACYERRREAMTITRQGRVRYRRAYDVGEACPSGQSPLDQKLSIQAGQMREQLVKVAARFGISAAYGRSAEALTAVTGVELSPNRVRQACLDLGQAVVETETTLLARRQDLSEPLRQRREAPQPERLYASLDGFYAPFEDGYHEVKRGAFWETTPANHATNVQYYLETEGLAAFSDLVWARAFERGANQAKPLIFIADGAVWIGRIVNQYFPHALPMVDFFHASAYLVTIAHAALGDGSLEAKTGLDHTKSAWYDGQLATVMAACRELQTRAPKAVADARHSFATNRTRLRYGKFRSLGLQIGSGTMESGCKQLGLARLTIAGARWSDPGARLLGKTRAAFLSREITLPSLGALQVA